MGSRDGVEKTGVRVTVGSGVDRRDSGPGPVKLKCVEHLRSLSLTCPLSPGALSMSFATTLDSHNCHLAAPPSSHSVAGLSAPPQQRDDFVCRSGCVTLLLEILP